MDRPAVPEPSITLVWPYILYGQSCTLVSLLLLRPVLSHFESKAFWGALRVLGGNLPNDIISENYLEMIMSQSEMLTGILYLYHCSGSVQGPV